MYVHTYKPKLQISFPYVSAANMYKYVSTVHYSNSLCSPKFIWTRFLNIYKSFISDIYLYNSVLEISNLY